MIRYIEMPGQDGHAGEALHIACAEELQVMGVDLVGAQEASFDIHVRGLWGDGPPPFCTLCGKFIDADAPVQDAEAK